MTDVPKKPKIYHITHIDNLGGIIKDGIWSDAMRIEREMNCEKVGMPRIKDRRLKLPVNCYQGTTVGQYVPFYFCPRSIMLFILYKDNHPDITYHEGQAPMVHLQADLESVIKWAQSNNIHWVFSSTNAGAKYALFYNLAKDLKKLKWQDINATDFRDASIKANKQAEFLVYGSFPWDLVEKIGVIEQQRAQLIHRILTKTNHKPLVSVEKTWYY